MGQIVHKQFYSIYGKGQDNIQLFKKNNNKKDFDFDN